MHCVCSKAHGDVQCTVSKLLFGYRRHPYGKLYFREMCFLVLGREGGGGVSMHVASIITLLIEREGLDCILSR